jgi:hypothetical protein
MGFLTPRDFESITMKMINLREANKMMYLNESFLKRFNLVIDTESMDYTIEDSITGKIYQGETYDKLFSKIKADLRKEKIEKLLNTK